MAALRIILTVILILVSIAFTVIVLMQEGKSAEWQGLARSAVRLRRIGARTRGVPWRAHSSSLRRFWALYLCCLQLF